MTPPSALPIPTFEHGSHLDWPQVVENGSPVAGWVRRGSQVKAMTARADSGCCTVLTYSRVPLDAPTPRGFSWTNLDLTIAARAWRDDSGNRVSVSEVNLRRVLAGLKIAGHIPGSQVDGALIARAREMVDATPGFVMTTHTGVRGTSIWIAPDANLGDVVDIPLLRDFYTLNGLPWALDGAEDIYLPAEGQTFDTHTSGITGAILGYPPASTVSAYRQSIR